MKLANKSDILPSELIDMGELGRHQYIIAFIAHSSDGKVTQGCCCRAFSLVYRAERSDKTAAAS